MHVFVTVVVRRVDGTCLSTVLFGGPVVALSQTADPNDDWWRWWRRRFGRLRPRLPSGLHGRPAAERHHRPNRDGTPYTLPLPSAIPSGCFPTQPPVDLVAMMRETAIVECPPREPPELPGGAFSLNSVTTFVFVKVTDPIGLLASINAAVETSTCADTEIDNERCRLRVCAWGGADSCHFSVRLYMQTTPHGTVFLAEFQRRSGDAFVFWRILRRSLDALLAAGFMVQPKSSWGAEAEPFERAEEELRQASARAMLMKDVRPVVRMVKAVYEDVRVEGCKMASSVASSTKNSVEGITSCIRAGLVHAIVRVMETKCGVESLTAATMAFDEWVSTDVGLREFRANGAASLINRAEAALKARVKVSDKDTDYTARQLKRMSESALTRLEGTGGGGFLLRRM